MFWKVKLHVWRTKMDFYSFVLYSSATLFFLQSLLIYKKFSFLSKILFVFLAMLFISLAMLIFFNKEDIVHAQAYILFFLTGAGLNLILVKKTNEKEELENILNQVPGHIYWKDKQGKNLGCNRQFWIDLKLSGESDYIGKTVFDLFPSEQAKKLTETDKMVISSTVPSVLEETVSRAKGESLTYITVKVPFYKNNKIHGIIGNSIDITAAKHREEQKLKTLDSVIALAPGHIYWLDREGKYLGCNEKQAKSAGLSSRNEIVGLKNKDLPWNKEDKKLVTALDKINEAVMSNAEPMENIEEIGRTCDGETLILKSSKVPILNEKNEVIGMVGASTDITELKTVQNNLELKNYELKNALQETNRASRERENTLSLYRQFVEDQEHDIRTPLGNVASCSEYLLTELSRTNKIEDELLLLLEGVSTSAREVLDYQESLLFELYQGQLSEETLFTRFDLPEIVQHAFNVNLVSARHKRIDYRYSYDDTIPNYLVGDGKRIYQCLVDLLSNAIRFTQQGEVKLDVECLEQNENIAIIRFTVIDTGIGIPEDKQTSILKAFVKAKPSNKGGERGRGLGLTRVSQYVSDMDGELRFDSTDGEGSCFRLVIPLKISLDQTDLR